MPFFTGMWGSGVLRREDGWSIVQLWIDMCHDHFGSLFTGVYKEKLGIWANKWFIMMKRPANKTKRHDPVSDGAVQSQACCSVNRSRCPLLLFIWCRTSKISWPGVFSANVAESWNKSEVRISKQFPGNWDGRSFLSALKTVVVHWFRLLLKISGAFRFGAPALSISLYPHLALSLSLSPLLFPAIKSWHLAVRHLPPPPQTDSVWHPNVTMTMHEALVVFDSHRLTNTPGKYEQLRFCLALQVKDSTFIEVTGSKYISQATEPEDYI